MMDARSTKVPPKRHSVLQSGAMKKSSGPKGNRTRFSRRLLGLPVEYSLDLDLKIEETQSSRSLIDLPAEILTTIADFLDITTRDGIDSLIKFRRTCSYIDSLLRDRSLKPAFSLHLAPYQQRALEPLNLNNIQGAQDLAFYHKGARDSLLLYVMPFVAPFEDFEDPRPDVFPGKGWRSIIEAGVLVRARVLGLEKLLALMFSALISQGCYDSRIFSPTILFSYAGSAWEYLRTLRSIYLTHGPDTARKLLRDDGVGRTRMDLQLWTVPVAKINSMNLGQLDPETHIRTTISDNMRTWFAEDVLKADAVFSAVGISTEGATTIRKCLEKWCKVEITNPNELPWNWPN